MRVLPLSTYCLKVFAFPSNVMCHSTLYCGGAVQPPCPSVEAFALPAPAADEGTRTEQRRIDAAKNNPGYRSSRGTMDLPPVHIRLSLDLQVLQVLVVAAGYLRTGFLDPHLPAARYALD